MCYRALVVLVSAAILAACGDKSEEALQLAAKAQQYLEAGQLPAARKTITEAIAERDDIPELHLLRGRIELAAGSFSAAYDAYSDALALDAANMEALRGVSQLGLQTGNLRDSLDATERILALYPQQPDALLVRGLHSVLRHRYGEAIEYADMILSTDRNRESGVILKARALSLSGKIAEALAIVNERELAGQQSAGLAMTRLEIYREMRAAQPMLEQFAVLERLRADDKALRIDEANLRYKTGDPVQAMKLLVALLANAKLDRETARQATALWQEYDRRGPDDGQLSRIGQTASSDSREEIARFYLANGDPARALRILEGMVTTGAQALTARARLLQGRLQEARRISEAILSHDETQCDALIVRSRLALSGKDVDEALRASQKAAAECPGNADAWLAIAAAYDARKQSAGAQRAFQQGLDANSQDLRFTRAYVDWLLPQGRGREAIAAARRLVRKAPALVGGWQYYGELCRRLNDSCAEDADAGLEAARTRYWIDQRPGETLPVGLFGRLAAS